MGHAVANVQLWSSASRLLFVSDLSGGPHSITRTWRLVQSRGVAALAGCSVVVYLPFRSITQALMRDYGGILLGLWTTSRSPHLLTALQRLYPVHQARGDHAESAFTVDFFLRTPVLVVCKGARLRFRRWKPCSVCARARLEQCACPVQCTSPTAGGFNSIDQTVFVRWPLQAARTHRHLHPFCAPSPVPL